MPQLIVFAGPNGSGKSTFISQLEAGALKLEMELPERVLNPDEFARRIDPVHPDRVMIEAGRAVLQQRAELLAARLDFAIETTLSGHGELRLVREARALGYEVGLVYIALEFPDQNLMRIERRREEQNRSIPSDVVLRRLPRSLAQLSKAVSLSDVAYIFDNSGRDFREIIFCVRGQIVRCDGALPSWAELSLASQLERHRQQT